MAVFRCSTALCLLAAAPLSQKVGTHVQEKHPELDISTCTSAGCSKESRSIVLDSNWRWVHNGQYTNCYKDGDWDKALCPDPEACSRNCYMDGAGISEYDKTYGVTTAVSHVNLDFMVETQYGTNYGSRIYLLEHEEEYKMFHLLNREFSVTVDMARMPCGLNGAIYFVEMDSDGGKSRSNGLNQAGAKYGTGYCDAQCPHDMKFINGLANSAGWNATSNPPVGKKGICCAEMDIWEANSRAEAYTPHPCTVTGPYACDGKECGDNEKSERYDGVCDKDGCDFNPFRMGDHDYYGRHGAFKVDSTKKLTVVTQFITSDNTDTGDLIDIRRFYVQGGVIIPNSNSSIAGVHGNSITDGFCSEMKAAFGDINDFQRKRGLKAMGESLGRGMVLVMSLWDDSLSDMLWLDSDYPLDKSTSTPGVARGPCETTTGSAKYVRSKYPTASAQYSDIRVGTIGSTTLTTGHGSNDDDEFGDDRRLRASVHV